MPFGFEDANVFIADDVTLGQELFSARPENSAAKDPPS